MSPVVQTPDEWLAEVGKPALEARSQFGLRSDDLLIVCAGFEDRALAALSQAISLESRFRVLMIRYAPFVMENRAGEILASCRKANLEFEEATYDRQDPAGFGLRISEIASSCTGRVVVDVSAMSRLLIVQTLVALAGRPEGFRNSAIVYSEAKEYPPTELEAEARIMSATNDPTSSILFLSSGVYDVTVVPELSSVAPPGTQTCMIAYPSLDAHQLTAIHAEMPPSRFDLIEGWPPRPENAWRRSAISRLNRLDEMRNATRFVVSTLDYRENLELLVRLYRARGTRERILVSPTGSKMQTVAVGIFRSFVRDVQIVYPTPQTFLTPTAYTLGTGELYWLNLDAFRAYDV